MTACILSLVCLSTFHVQDRNDLQHQLAAALIAEDASRIAILVEKVNKQLGNKAGVPESPDQYLPIPRNAQILTADEARVATARLLPKLETQRWWKIGLDPTKLTHPLREPAAVCLCMCALHRAGVPEKEKFLQHAREAGDFLLWAQEQAGTGGFPFPASRGLSKAAPFVAAERYFQRMEKEGRLGDVIKNGWVVVDEGDGGLQFDNGECGVALVELYQQTKDERYLAGARKSADWAARQPLVTNWNYNSFSVFLLARVYRETKNVTYLQAARKKALLGVIPGQLTYGPFSGRWNDPHNARPAYHYIMLRSLAELAYALPADDADRSTIEASLRRGLVARNQDYVTKGAPNMDKAVEVLLFLARHAILGKKSMEETKSTDALNALLQLISEQARQGRIAVGPREWGQLVEFLSK